MLGTTYSPSSLPLSPLADEVSARDASAFSAKKIGSTQISSQVSYQAKELKTEDLRPENLRPFDQLVQNKTVKNTEELVYRMATNERTAGPLPEWTNSPTAKEEVLQDLAKAGLREDEIPDSAMAYAGRVMPRPSKPFSPVDFLDVVNPLQHIPVVNKIYRDLTGDAIHPVTQIAGGTLYGGALGAAGSALNAAVEYETGHDVASAVYARAIDGRQLPTRTGPKAGIQTSYNFNDYPAQKTLESSGIRVADTLLNKQHIPPNKEAFTAYKTASTLYDSFSLPKEPVTQLKINSAYRHNQ